MKPLTFLAGGFCGLYLIGYLAGSPQDKVEAKGNPTLSEFTKLAGVSAGNSEVTDLHVKVTHKVVSALPAWALGNCADVKATGTIVWTSDFTKTKPTMTGETLEIPQPRPTSVSLTPIKTNGCNAIYKSDQPIVEAENKLRKQLCDLAKTDKSDLGERMVNATESVQALNPKLSVSFFPEEETGPIRGCQ